MLLRKKNNGEITHSARWFLYVSAAFMNLKDTKCPGLHPLKFASLGKGAYMGLLLYSPFSQPQKYQFLRLGEIAAVCVF
jgi:hypothetical protein